jgi:hypothetical protein
MDTGGLTRIRRALLPLAYFDKLAVEDLNSIEHQIFKITDGIFPIFVNGFLVQDQLISNRLHVPVHRWTYPYALRGHGNMMARGLPLARALELKTNRETVSKREGQKQSMSSASTSTKIPSKNYMAKCVNISNIMDMFNTAPNRSNIKTCQPEMN